MRTKVLLLVLYLAGIFAQNIQAQTVVETIVKEEAETFWQSFKTFCLYKDAANISQFVADTLWVYNQDDSCITKEYFTAKQVKKDMRKPAKKTMELVPEWNAAMATIGVENSFTTQFNVNEYAPGQKPEYATRSVEFRVNPECANEYIYSTTYRLDNFESSTIYYFKKINGQIKFYKKINRIVQESY